MLNVNESNVPSECIKLIDLTANDTAIKTDMTVNKKKHSVSDRTNLFVFSEVHSSLAQN